MCGWKVLLWELWELMTSKTGKMGSKVCLWPESIKGKILKADSKTSWNAAGGLQCVSVPWQSSSITPVCDSMAVMQLRCRGGNIPRPADRKVACKPEVTNALKAHCSHPHSTATVLPRQFSVSLISLLKRWSERNVPNAEHTDVVITVRFCTGVFKGWLEAFLVEGPSKVTAFSGVSVELFQWN